MESDEGGYDYADLEGVWRRGVIVTSLFPA
jgi:hypothetical protein